MGMHERVKVKNDAKTRIKSIAFGDAVTNVCAGDENPRRHAYFCKHVIKRSKNRAGIVFTHHFAKLTDKKGNFWDVDIEVIFNGHLGSDECKNLFAPIWEANYR